MCVIWIGARLLLVGDVREKGHSFDHPGAGYLEVMRFAVN